MEFVQHCQAFYPIDKDWPKIHMGWSTKTRIEGWIQINSYFEATHPWMAILITHWLEHFTVGSYFTQLNDDGQKFVVAYANRFNNKTKAKCSSYEGECFAIIWDVSSFHYYIYHKPFTLVTNYHQPFKFLIASHQLTWKLTKWALIVYEHDFDIVDKTHRVHWNVDEWNQNQSSSKDDVIKVCWHDDGDL